MTNEVSFVYDLLRAGTTSANSDTGAQVARKINNNFSNAAKAMTELEKKIADETVQHIKIGSLDQPIVDGSVEIPIAGLQNCGVIKSSEDENKIRISEDGTAEVVSLNINKLVQDDGDYIIFDGNFDN